MELLITGAIIAALGGGYAVAARAAESSTASLARPKPLPAFAPIGQDARDLRTFDAWITHPGHGVTPQAIVSAFREAERGNPSPQCDLFDDLIEADGHLRNLFEQREQAVAGKPWVVQSGGDHATGNDADEDRAARVMGSALRALPMIHVFRHLLGVNRYGYSAVEIDWGIRNIEGEDWIVPIWLTPVQARRFRVSTLDASNGTIDELRLFADIARPSGDALRPTKWITLRKSLSQLARGGLMRTAAWPALGKRLSYRDWLVLSQRFGIPLPIAKYKEGADDETIETAKEVVRRIGSDGGASMPDSIALDFFDALRGNADNSKTHGGLIAFCNAEMSKLVNGSTLSNDNTGSGGASYALGEVHASVRWDNVLFDAETLQEAFRTQLFVPFMHFNNLKGAAPVLKLQVVRDLDPKTRTAIAAQLRNELGVEISKSQLRQELGFREPSDDDDAAPGAPPKTPAAPKGEPA